MSDDKNVNYTPINAMQYIYKQLTDNDMLSNTKKNMDESVFNDIANNYWQDESIYYHKDKIVTFKKYLSEQIGQKYNQECLDIISDALSDIQHVDGEYNLSEDDFKDNEEYYAKLMEEKNVKAVSAEDISNDIKEILASDNPDKEEILNIVINCKAEIFAVMQEFPLYSKNSIFNLVKENFSPEDAKEIMHTMGFYAAENMADRVDQGSWKYQKELDLPSIQDYLIFNVQGDDSIETNECMLEFAKGFIDNSGSFMSEIYKAYDKSQWAKLVDAVASAEEKALALKTNYLNSKIDEQDEWVFKSENGIATRYVETPSGLCYFGAFYNSLINSGEKGMDMASSLIKDAEDSYEVNFGDRIVSVSKDDVYKNLQPGKKGKATIMKLAIEQAFPEGTGVSGKGAMGGRTSEYSGNLETLMQLVNKDIKVNHWESIDSTGNVGNRGNINSILNKLSDDSSEKIAIVSFYSSKDSTTSKVKDYRSDIEYTVAQNSPHSLSILDVTEHYVTLLDPDNPNQNITVSKEEFVEKAQYIEWCNL